MRYMMLIYSTERDATPEERRTVAEAHISLMQEAERRGALIAASPLEPTSTATTVRIKDNGHVLVTDGPFAETKEQLAGYYLLECANLDEAIEWAGRVPTSCLGANGAVEVRPLRTVSPQIMAVAPSSSFIANG
jgi:hypothetical protein